VIQSCNAIRPTTKEVIAMLSEKFFLLLETLRSHSSNDKPPVVISMTPHVPKELRRKQEGAEAVTGAALSKPGPAPVSTA
jgi:hypothetical protein